LDWKLAHLWDHLLEKMLAHLLAPQWALKLDQKWVG
jgi:hypothetical protein